MEIKNISFLSMFECLPFQTKYSSEHVYFLQITYHIEICRFKTMTLGKIESGKGKHKKGFDTFSYFWHLSFHLGHLCCHIHQLPLAKEGLEDVQTAGQKEKIPVNQTIVVTSMHCSYLSHLVCLGCQTNDLLMSGPRSSSAKGSWYLLHVVDMTMVDLIVSGPK